MGADPVAALLMVPWLVKEGLEGLRGQHCERGCGRDRQREKDAERLLQILTIDPEVLCLTQRERA